jgi:hypothetical protein
MLSSRSRTARSTSSIKGPLLFVENATSTEYSAGLKRAIEKGWLELRERGLHAQDKRPVSASTAASRSRVVGSRSWP